MRRSVRPEECMVALNLPARELRLERDSAGVVKVYDPLRRKSVVLTPEEWVRQHFAAHLIADRGYPAGLVGNEVGLNLNGLRRRCDSVVWSARTGSPLMLIEYKAPAVKITRRVFDQVVRYNVVFRAPFLTVSNGLEHYCCKVNLTEGKYEFLPAIPSFEELSAEDSAR